jgi:hypothetical protein
MGCCIPRYGYDFLWNLLPGAPDLAVYEPSRAEIDGCSAPVRPSSAIGFVFSYLDESALVREDHDLCPVTEVELGEDVRYM